MKRLSGRYELILIFLLFILSIPAEYTEIFSLSEDQMVSFRHLMRNAFGDRDKTAFPYDKIVIVTVDDAFFDKYQGFPLKRTDIARIIDNLKALGANVIGVDMLMKFTSSYGEDPILSKTLADAGNTVLASQALFDKEGRFLKIRYPAAGLKEASKSGYVNIMSHSFMTYLNRLRIYPEITKYDDGLPIAIQIAARYLGVSPRLENRELFLGHIKIPLDQFNEFYIDFPAIPKNCRYIHEIAGISAWNFLDISGLDENERHELKLWVDGKIVVFGDTNQISGDLFDTPVGSVYGVEIIADTIATILKQAPIRPASLPTEILLSFLFLSAIVSCFLFINRPVLRNILVVTSFAGYLFICTILYISYGTVISMSYSLLSGGSAYFILTLRDYFHERKLKAEIRAQSEHIRQIFGRYLSDDIVREILDFPEGLKLGGEKKNVTVMMTDLRGFTGMGEKLPPEKVVSLLNNYLQTMTAVIIRYKGTIDHFIGDAIVVVFGAPVSRGDDAKRAVACAIDMQLAMDSVNKWNREHDLPVLAMGIGLNSGDAIVGNIGSEQRSQYDVIGSTVNLASRIESYTIGGQVFISEKTMEDIGDILKIGGKMEVLPKGIRKPITIYEVRGIGGEFNIYLPEILPEVFYEPVEKLSADITPISGKHACSETISAVITGLTSDVKKARIHCETQIGYKSNLKLSIYSSDGRGIAKDIYGKVSDISDNTEFIIDFTYAEPEAEFILKTLINSP